MNTNTRFALGILADHVGVDKMPEGGSAMWAVPGLLDLAHVSDLVEKKLTRHIMIENRKQLKKVSPIFAYQLCSKQFQPLHWFCRHARQTSLEPSCEITFSGQIWFVHK